MEYKGFKILGDGTFGYKTIKSVGAGAVPKSLSGVYTSNPIAMKAIDAYVEVKETKNARAKSTAGSK